ncbi:regulatory protein RecX [Arthrobacter sp. FB24]|nr:regulatory protein RecX [Arthrobacter sp. FB24]
MTVSRGNRPGGGRRSGPGFRSRKPGPAEFGDAAQEVDGLAGAGFSPAPQAGQDSEPDPASVARAIVLRQLTNSPKSRLQLARKLAERNVPDDVAESVLDRFEEVRLVDDAEFADMWVRSRSQTRKLARGALRRELADKGIEPDVAARALEQLSDEAEESAARQLVERKLKASADLTDRAERDKVTRRLASMLARKGYQPSQAFRIVGEVLEAAAGERAATEFL